MFFTKIPNLKKSICSFFLFFGRGGGGGRGGGEGLARVSECLTMDPNKNVFGGEWRGARVNEFLLLRIHI